MDEAPTRERTLRWHDPVALAAAVRKRSGREAMEALLAGTLPAPPIAELFGFTVTMVDEGRVEFTCRLDESMYNPIGSIHGGVVCTLLDTVIGCAVHTTLPAGVGYTSIDLQISYLRAVAVDSGPLVAQGTVTKPGRRVAFARGEVVDAAGRLVASGTGSCLVMPLPEG